MEKAMTNRTKRLSRLGNSVVPDCAEWMGRAILAHAEMEGKQ
jgi:site-specific DNA-cytosine methylase